MLCFPGLTPVAKLDHAVGDSEGCVDPRGLNVPSAASRFRLGSFPASIHLRARAGSMPSKPMTNTRCAERRAGFAVFVAPVQCHAVKAQHSAHANPDNHTGRRGHTVVVSDTRGMSRPGTASRINAR